VTVVVTVWPGTVCVTVVAVVTVTVEYCDAAADPFLVATAAAANPAATITTAKTAASRYLTRKRYLLSTS
jgi:hypothetical protein